MAYKGQPTNALLKMEMSANKMFGAPAKAGKSVMKMSPAKVAARKKTMISNAATKVMGGQYSK